MTQVAKITKSIGLILTNHSVLRINEREDGKGCKIVRCLKNNQSELNEFIRSNECYDYCMFHDRNLQICFVAEISMGRKYGYEYVVNIITVPPYKYRNFCHEDTMLIECKH